MGSLRCSTTTSNLCSNGRGESAHLRVLCVSESQLPPSLYTKSRSLWNPLSFGDYTILTASLGVVPSTARLKFLTKYSALPPVNNFFLSHVFSSHYCLRLLEVRPLVIKRVPIPTTQPSFIAANSHLLPYYNPTVNLSFLPAEPRLISDSLRGGHKGLFVGHWLSTLFFKKKDLVGAKHNHQYVTPLRIFKQAAGVGYANYAAKFMTSLIIPQLEVLLNAPTSLSVSFSFASRVDRITVNYVNLIKLRLRYLAAVFVNVLFISEFVDIVFYALASRNLKGFLEYIRRIFNRLSIWEHKRFATVLINLFYSHFLPLFPLLNIQGLYFQIKGKLGVGGNSRKRKVSLKIGKTATSWNSAAASFVNSTITTPTGVLGVKLLVLTQSNTLF